METVGHAAHRAAAEPPLSAIGRSRASERRIGRFVLPGIALLTIAQSAYSVHAVWVAPGESCAFALLLYDSCVVSALLALVLDWRATAASGVIAGGTVALTVAPMKHDITRLCERVLARWPTPGHIA